MITVIDYFMPVAVPSIAFPRLHILKWKVSTRN